jgi:ribosomal protein S12 methylthiotransferase accessory factor
MLIFTTDESEKLDEILSSLKPVLFPEFNLISALKLEKQYSDEPSFWYFSSNLNDRFIEHQGHDFYSQASGTSFYSAKEALIKCLAESVERICNFVFLESSVELTASIKTLQNKKYKFIDPRKIPRFSEKQKEKLNLIDASSPIRWTTFKSMSNNDSYYFPCQSTYLSYSPLKNEPAIYPSISTGVAGRDTLDSAILHGIYEVVERDAFMIHYLNKIPPKTIDLLSSANEKILYLYEIAKQYHLQLYCIDITTDIQIPTVAAVVIDTSGYGKAVSVGLKTDMDIEMAVIGAITEAFHTRTWVRKEYESSKQTISKNELIENSSILNRALFWYPTSSIKHINFWLKKSQVVSLKHKKNVKTNLKIVQDIISRNKLHIYWKEITLPQFNKVNYHIVKVVIPELQQLYLNEKYPLLGGERLRTVPEHLNAVSLVDIIEHYPHPFL